MNPSLSGSLSAEAQVTFARIANALGKEPTAPTQEPADPLWEELLERAALSGWFSLSEIVRPLPEPARMRLRSALSRVSQAETVNGRRLHMLDLDTRDRVLARLRREPKALQERLDGLRLDADDSRGRELRQMLRGKHPNIERAGDARLADLLAVSVWLDRTGGSPVEPRAVRLEISARASEEGLKVLLADGFFGREESLEELRTFTMSDQEQSERVLIVGGAGGVGKSSLLARFILDMRRLKPRPLVFHFDFDTRSYDPRRPATLTLELTRQLAAAFPHRAEELSRVRSTMRQTLALETSGTDTLGSSYRAESEGSFLLGDVIREEVGPWTDHAPPIVLVLDSFEELMSRSDASVGLLRQWISYLRRDLMLEKAKVIISGRAAEEAQDELDAERVLELGDLPRDCAIELLETHGLFREDGTAIFEAFGGNPLMLRLAGRFLSENPEVKVADLVREDGDSGGEVVQGMLYKRILGHIGTGRDDPLRRVALPGLALRRVTPALIADVIAPVVGPQEIGLTAARELWTRLVGQIWLVRRVPGEEVAEHRRDLRRIMMGLLRRDPELRPQAEALHRAAMSYYAANRDATLDADQAKREALYHRMMLLERGATLSISDREILQSALRGDLDDLPAHAKALAGYYLAMPLGGEEAKLLPQRYIYPWAVRQGWQYIQSNRTPAAMKLATSLGATLESDRPPAWLLTALHHMAAWTDAGPLLERTEAAIAKGQYEDGPSLDPSYGEFEHTISAAAAVALLRLERHEHERVAALPAQKAISRNLDAKLITRLPGQRVQRTLQFISYCMISARLSGARLPSRLTPPHDQLELIQRMHGAEGQALLSRITVLNWAAGRAKPETRLRLLAENIDPSPHGIVRLERLVTELLGAPRLPQPTANRVAKQWADFSAEWRNDRERPVATAGGLLGTYAIRIAKIFEDVPITLEDLQNAGLHPRDLSGGLLSELSRLVRYALAACIRGSESQIAFAGRLYEAIGVFDPEAPSGVFIPADLEAGHWLRVAREDVDRAFGTLAEYAAQIGRLEELLTAAIATADADVERLSRVEGAVVSWYAAFTPAPAAP